MTARVQHRVGGAARTALSIGVFAACAGGARAPSSQCFEGVCITLRDGARTESRGHRHSIRTPGRAAWINVQRVQSPPDFRGDDLAAAETLASRHRASGFADGVVTGRETVGRRSVAFEEARLVWRGETYRRRTWITRGAGAWTAVDVTALARDFPQGLVALNDTLSTLRWGGEP